MGRRTPAEGSGRASGHSERRRTEALLSLRALVLLSVAFGTGLLAGGLSYAGGLEPAGAAVVGLSTFLAALTALHKLVGR